MQSITVITKIYLKMITYIKKIKVIDRAPEVCWDSTRHRDPLLLRSLLWSYTRGSVVPIFQMRKLRSGEVKSLADGPSGGGIWAHIEPVFWWFNASVLFPKLQSFLYTLKIFHIYVLPGTVSQLMFFLNFTHFFKIRALLRYNPHTIWSSI